MDLLHSVTWKKESSNKNIETEAVRIFVLVNIKCNSALMVYWEKSATSHSKKRRRLEKQAPFTQMEKIWFVVHIALRCHQAENAYWQEIDCNRLSLIHSRKIQSVVFNNATLCSLIRYLSFSIWGGNTSAACTIFKLWLWF